MRSVSACHFRRGDLSSGVDYLTDQYVEVYVYLRVLKYTNISNIIQLLLLEQCNFRIVG